MTVLSHMYVQSDKIRLGATTRAQDLVPSLRTPCAPPPGRPPAPVRRSGESSAYKGRGTVSDELVTFISILWL